MLPFGLKSICRHASRCWRDDFREHRVKGVGYVGHILTINRKLMFPRFLALVSETARVSSLELARVAAALNKQATRDITPFWGVQAGVDAFINLEDVPPGYWPMIVRDDIGFPGAAGIHLDANKPGSSEFFHPAARAASHKAPLLYKPMMRVLRKAAHEIMNHRHHRLGGRL
jgi:hypothetical protein